MSENEIGQAQGSGEILGVAKKMATAGDRWFVSFARGFGRAAGRVKKETDIVVDSAKAAAVTTGRVTSKMVRRMKPRFTRSTPERSDPGTSDSLLKTVALHYSVAETVLRANQDALDTIELLHRICSFHFPSPSQRRCDSDTSESLHRACSRSVNDGAIVMPDAKVDVSAGDAGAAASTPDRQSESVPLEVADPESVRDDLRTEHVDPEPALPESTPPESATLADPDTTATQKRKRRGFEQDLKHR
jgi:hypothetical protein